MNNEDLNLTNDAYSLHRILKTDIKKDPSLEEDEISDRSNKTIIMISHQLSVAATCDRVLVICLLYTSPSPRDGDESRMPSSA